MSKKIKNKIAIGTLGCKVNQYDSQALGDLLEEEGYDLVPFSARADIYIINSCAVTGSAINKSRKKINRAKKTNPKAKIILSGCWPQTGAKEFPDISVVHGTKDRKKILQIIDDYIEPVEEISSYDKCEKFEEMKIKKFLNRSRAVVKIQDGCQQFCSYCIIPYARGPLRSRDYKEVIKQINELVNIGYKEVVLTGIHLGLYGVDLGKNINLTILLKELVKINGLERIRLSSIEINEVIPELIKLIKKEKKICNHLHIPLQNGSDKILSLMNRPYNKKQFLKQIKEIRKNIPEISITTDVIVGFPGETESDFIETYKMCEQINFSKMHVFSFSGRKGTPAYEMLGQIDKDTVARRSKKLRELSEIQEENYAKKFIGKDLEVLPQGRVGGGKYILGLTDNYLTVKFKGKMQKKIVIIKPAKNIKHNLIGE
jgi:threonylcarbamoyladenosine tRNA methylthiotransferase MtaB